ncbi:esterase/lipase family protein [Rhodoblastus sp.]|uniref:esterase/lipase family protein n=1 Tax=Rhodoblastus sp. TaxID=1962975 RepID=UPI003F973AB9
MMARLLQLAFVLVVALAGVSGAVAARAWDVGDGVLVFMLALVAFQIATPLLAYGLSARDPPPPAASATLARRIAAVLEELFAFWQTFVVLQPFARLWRREAALPSASARTTPVLLIPGYCCNEAMWRPLQDRLRAAGRLAASATLDPPFAGIDELADRLDEEVERLLAATGAAKVVLVGHSMGGLIARAYLARRGRDRVAALITTGTPHHGSKLALLGLGRDARQMEPGSAWLRELNSRPPPVPTHSIWSARDEFVVPRDSARLDGARETVLALPGHFGLLRAPQVLEAVLEASDQR